MKILVADDSEMTRMILQGRLSQWGYDIVNAGDGYEAWDMLQKKDKPRMILLDWMMPNMNGIELCKKIRKQIKEPYIYIILLTAKKGKEHLIEAMEAGADDFITKPFDPHILKVRLRAGYRITRLQDELIDAREELRIQATHDSLTQLFNRSALMNMMTREISRSQRDNSSIGIIMIDIDHFKSINDNHGHLIGDDVLKILAEQMKQCTRRYDTIGRYGGEEFIIVLPQCGKTEVHTVAERLRQQVCQQPYETSVGAIDVTISLGATWITPSDQDCANENIIRVVDKGLYAAKHKGRNTTVLFDYQHMTIME
ncbi:MAG: response regulator receiver modulated diguanylate cyclase [Candidatus Magnetoglobus multicellularis str. Araruama]|uniref:diguanylate cyclase n=1 Tax=Candidatus Magnetoglobus multicellularis str. Araruama TaxID=890399 RepID=A0A1V1P178_9BACT|nr:MAG: response regulator receiver modulated diguanylate cyclase [Candidatus Magnetoglobus multicellularis str. Araruama]